MNKDLKWLAENVHEWFEGECSAIQKDDYGAYCFLYGSDPNQYSGVGEICFTRAQWQAARDELSGKPSWDDAPEWAQWLAQDEDGRWFWYAGDKPDCKEPFFEASTPVCDDQDHLIAGHGRVFGDWRNTLERRPENHSVEPTGKVWRGSEDGLPPVDTECEISNCKNLFTWCRVKYMGERLCVVDHKTHKDQHYHLSSVEFRPIRSEEDKAIEEMLEVCKQGSVSYPTSEEMVRRLYRAGYRKQENPE